MGASPLLRATLAAALGVALGGCGGGDPREGAEADGETPVTGADWIQAERQAKRVTLTIVAGQTPENSYWNFNGLHGGTGTVVIPTGWDVFVEFRNDDPDMAHSLGLDRATHDFPTDFAPIEAAFPNAITTGAGSDAKATAPGGVNSFRFQAMEPGAFSLVCYVPGHAAVGQFLPVTVSDGAPLPRFDPGP